MVNLTNLEGFVVKKQHWSHIRFLNKPKTDLYSEGALKFGFGKDVPQRNLKVDSYKYQFFQKKWSIHIPIGHILRQILKKITRFFQKITLIWFLTFWLKFGKMLKNRPIHKQKFGIL